MAKRTPVWLSQKFANDVVVQLSEYAQHLLGTEGKEEKGVQVFRLAQRIETHIIAAENA